MKNNQISIFVIDDDIPKSPQFASESIYDSGISSKDLYQLAKTQTWRGLQPLQQLIIDIVTSTPFKENYIQLSGYTKPTQCLTDIENGIKPDILIYDWEYGMPNPIESQQWLLDILSLTDAFIFVYSRVRDTLPTFLNKAVFDNFASRFQLLEKGNSNFSIFTTEEFIFQYILGRVSGEYEFTLQGERKIFKSNGFLREASDILFLEKIFGKKHLLSNLKKQSEIISEVTVINMLSEIDEKIHFDELNMVLITNDSNILLKKYKPTKTFTYLEVVNNFGLEVLVTVLEIGIAKIYQ